MVREVNWQREGKAPSSLGALVTSLSPSHPAEAGRVPAPAGVGVLIGAPAAWGLSVPWPARSAAPSGQCVICGP